MKNSARQFVSIIKTYCEQNKIEIISLSHDWIFVLRGASGNKIIFGYDLGLNSSSVLSTARDKAATFDVLGALGISAVEHKMFLAPRFLKHIEQSGNWQRIIDCHERNNLASVVKPNEGTGGLDVFLVHGADELEGAVHEVLSRERSVALSPYLSIEREVRAYVAFDEVPLLYEKVRPFITGDGASQTAELAWKKFGADALSGLVQDRPSDRRQEFLSRIPAAGVDVPLGWKHNLGQGSKLRALSVTAHEREIQLAKATAAAMGLNFGAIDIVEIDGQLKILEVNSGVMFENAIRGGGIEYDVVYGIYSRALDTLLKKSSPM
ncbi:MAG: hypothetical protein QGG19_09340 [Alphaproteobacteria bacterium]|jgi:hypothetical protein|nr:hypothetical protein [Rhodospirillaceae bacterium]MDP6021488.1 hypothetical protein [Alphaproteobacteria bacterium]MDP6253487.1 hypothetical protein [Alphaproteobacteria bacterium]MDP7054773.1 hypothetical protein [Alphaproteobacteria bacterium]MDP7227647.1 hypothetical protein [Alphaproteobacteria bacterium]|tara:strand:+ start:5016 stop:5981 length:966 start_codon:yes stop_codon:yes gene_type:complete